MNGRLALLCHWNLHTISNNGRDYRRGFWRWGKGRWDIETLQLMMTLLCSPSLDILYSKPSHPSPPVVIRELEEDVGKSNGLEGESGELCSRRTSDRFCGDILSILSQERPFFSFNMQTIISRDTRDAEFGMTGNSVMKTERLLFGRSSPFPIMTERLAHMDIEEMLSHRFVIIASGNEGTFEAFSVDTDVGFWMIDNVVEEGWEVVAAIGVANESSISRDQWWVVWVIRGIWWCGTISFE